MVKPLFRCEDEETLNITVHEGISLLRSPRYGPESGACVDGDLPKASIALEVPLQASLAQQSLDNAGAMDEEAEWITLKSREDVD